MKTHNIFNFKKSYFTTHWSFLISQFRRNVDILWEGRERERDCFGYEENDIFIEKRTEKDYM